MRRAASATSIGLRAAPAAGGQRPGSVSVASVPRRRPGTASGARNWEELPSFAARPPAAAPYAPQLRPPTAGLWGAAGGPAPAGHAGRSQLRAPTSGLWGTGGAPAAAVPAAGKPGSYWRTGLHRSPSAPLGLHRSPSAPVAPPRHAAEHHYHQPQPHGPCYDHHALHAGCGASPGTGFEEAGGDLSEARLKIYSDLFEEVIERDRVFGPLLRKIKTAYDVLLEQPHEMERTPQMPLHGHFADSFTDERWHPHQDMPGSWQSRAGAIAAAAAAAAGRPYGGPPSTEPTTRAERGGDAWELHRENRVLKDLVERLHLELEEAVKREHRWKQKVVKLKERAASANTSHASAMQSYLHLTVPPGYSMVVPAHEQWSHGHLADGYPATHPAEEARRAHHHAAAPGPPVRAFHPSRREPGPGDADGHEGAHLNQGGLLSMSSISPQTSMPLVHEPLDGAAASGADTPGSEDSGRLPQRPCRRHIVTPAHVPPLDFSRLKHQLEEEEEEEEEGELPEEGADGDPRYYQDQAGVEGDSRYYDGQEDEEEEEGEGPEDDEGFGASDGEGSGDGSDAVVRERETMGHISRPAAAARQQLQGKYAAPERPRSN